MIKIPDEIVTYLNVLDSKSSINIKEYVENVVLKLLLLDDKIIIDYASVTYRKDLINDPKYNKLSFNVSSLYYNGPKRIVFELLKTHTDNKDNKEHIIIRFNTTPFTIYNSKYIYLQTKRYSLIPSLRDVNEVHQDFNFTINNILMDYVKSLLIKRLNEDIYSIVYKYFYDNFCCDK